MSDFIAVSVGPGVIQVPNGTIFVEPEINEEGFPVFSFKGRDDIHIVDKRPKTKECLTDSDWFVCFLLPGMITHEIMPHLNAPADHIFTIEPLGETEWKRFVIVAIAILKSKFKVFNLPDFPWTDNSQWIFCTSPSQ